MTDKLRKDFLDKVIGLKAYHQCMLTYQLLVSDCIGSATYYAA